MQVSDFERSPIGTLVPITGHDAARREDYKDWAYVPKSLPSTVDLSMKTQKAVSEASLALGRLDFAVRRLPKPSLLVRPALRREAQSTSALEGTYATLQEVLEGDFIERSNLRAEVR